MEHTQCLVDRWFRRTQHRRTQTYTDDLLVDPWYSFPRSSVRDRVPSESSASESSAPGLLTDSGESETDEDATDDEYVRVQYRVLHKEVDGQVDFVVVILSVVRPPASLMGLIYNLALV
jgi:hypothetical protein